MSDIHPRAAPQEGAHPPDAEAGMPSIWGVDGCVVWPSVPGRSGSCRSKPPVPGRRDVVFVRDDFATPHGETFWTLHESEAIALHGWDAGSAEDIVRIAMVRCRAVGELHGRPGGVEGWRAVDVEVVEVLSLSYLADGPPRGLHEPGFQGWIAAGWEMPKQNYGRSSAIGWFELISGDMYEIICTAAPGGPEVLMVVIDGLGRTDVWAGRRPLTPADLGILRDGVAPDRIECAAGAGSILA